MVQHDDLETASDYFRALGNPSRLAILHVLAEGPSGVTALAERLGLSQPLVSQHLTVLHGARLVCRARHGRAVHYALADAHVAHMLDDVLSHVTETQHPHHEGEPHD